MGSLKMLNSDDLTRTVASFLASVVPPSLEHIEVQKWLLVSRSYYDRSRLNLDGSWTRTLVNGSSYRSLVRQVLLTWFIYIF